MVNINDYNVLFYFLKQVLLYVMYLFLGLSLQGNAFYIVSELRTAAKILGCLPLKRDNCCLDLLEITLY